jgi:hypothetical protein
MRQKHRTAVVWIALLSGLVLGAAVTVSAQERQAPPERASEMALPADQSRQAIEGQIPGMQDQSDQVRQTAAQAPALSATLLDREQKAKAREATVQVQVAGVEIIDPASVSDKPQQGQAHLHYQLDSGPVIATTATKLSFHELPPGKHTITVILAGNNHSPLGPKETLQVTIPGKK